MSLSLQALLAGWLPADPLPEVTVTGLAMDSRRVRPGDLFLAVPGLGADGRDYIDDAVARGAVAVLAAAEAVAVGQHPTGVPVVQVPDLPGQLGRIAALFHNDPSAEMTLVGVTGTNGKTTVSHQVAQALGLLGTPAGVMGTLGAGFPGRLCTDSGLTTADPLSLQRTLASLRSAGAQAACMEVSSHGLDQDRVQGLVFDVAVFTNLSRDHLDYHGSMAAYAAAKKKLFQRPGLRAAVLNVDDPLGRELATEQAGQLQVLRCALDNDTAEVRITDVQPRPDGQAFTLATAAGAWPLRTPLLGRFNLANLALVAGTLHALGHAWDAVAGVLPSLTAVPGRMHALHADGAPLVVVDYAHTPDALEQALSALRPHVADGGRLWCLFGCGGDRDRGKRPAMGAAAARLADVAVVTDDNPRTEDGDRIVADVQAGMHGARAEVRVQRDRAVAIREAVAAAAPGDVVLVAGKGHEAYQDVAGERRPWSDIDAVQGLLAARGGQG